MTPQEIETIRAMSRDELVRQFVLEAIVGMRVFNRSLVDTVMEQAQYAAGLSPDGQGAPLCDLADHRQFKADAAELLDVLNRFRGSMARFAELAETRLDKAGLIEPADGMTYEQSAERMTAVNAIGTEILDRWDAENGD